MWTLPHEFKSIKKPELTKNLPKMNLNNRLLIDLAGIDINCVVDKFDGSFFVLP